MKKIITFLFLLSSFVFGQNLWINEVSYDMTGGDADDFIEIVAPVGTDMAEYGILLANGNGDQGYEYVQLTGKITSTNADNGFGFMVILTGQSSSVSVPSGILQQASGFSSIQNGSPDGVLLLNHTTGATIHGLWYEETSTPPTEIADNSFGPGGPYSMTNVDVTNERDDGSSSAGESMSMVGSGLSHTWTGQVTSTAGNINTNQTALPVELTIFSASIVDNNVELIWETATEVNNYGFEVERQNSDVSSQKSEWSKLGFVEGHGNSNSPKFYSYTDNTIEASGNYQYRLKQIDIDGTFEYSDVVEVNLGTPEGFTLNQNYPNPFNPTTTIKFNLPNDGNVKLSVFNVLGEEVAELLNENITAGYHSINFNASELNSGIYFYKLETNNFTQIRKMMLVK